MVPSKKEDEDEAEEEDPFDIFGDDDDDDDDDKAEVENGCDDNNSDGATANHDVVDSAALRLDHNDLQLQRRQQHVVLPAAFDKSISSSTFEMNRRDNESCGVLAFHTGTELALLHHVKSEITMGIPQEPERGGGDSGECGESFNSASYITMKMRQADDVLYSIDKFCFQRHWMMHIGQEKGKVLETFLSQCFEASETNKEQHSDFVCVELGTYCGYSSIWLARCVLKQFVDRGLGVFSSTRRRPRFKIYTVEIVPEHVTVAEELIRLAAMNDFIEVILFDPYSSSCDEHELSRLVNDRIIKGRETKNGSNNAAVWNTAATIDFLLIDHDKTKYLEDLKGFESSGLIRRGCYVAADNVVFAGIYDYRKYIQELQAQKIVTTKLVETMIEYSEPEVVRQLSNFNYDTTDQQDQIDQFKDGIELSIYKHDPLKSRFAVESSTKVTAIILPVLVSSVKPRPENKTSKQGVLANVRINPAGTSIVTVEAPSPIQTSPSFNRPALLALLLGIILLLHTPAWLFMLHYKNGNAGFRNIDMSVPKSFEELIDILSFVILDLILKFASTVLNIFLAGLCLLMGWSSLSYT